MSFLLGLLLAAAQYPEMTPIPGGEFEMGDHHNFVDPGHPSDEVPVHKVWIDGLAVGTYDVTNRQYVEFLNSAHAQGLIEIRDGMVYGKSGNDAYCETRAMADYSSIGWDGEIFTVVDFRGNHPAIGIRWHGAAAYTNWLSRLQGYEPCYDTSTWKCDFSKNGYRLPTEAEWEYAARGGRCNPYRNFPWGDDADYTKANWPDSNDPYETGALPWTTPVGFYDGRLKRKSDFNWPGSQETYQTADGSNGFGLYDMSGNVWQWCHDWYHRDYYSASPYANPPGPDTASPMPDGQPYRVLRGGNWYNGDRSDPGHGRVSNRDPAYFRGPQDPNHPYYHVGFRVVRPLPPWTMVRLAADPPVLSDNGDETVTDAVTGLLWQKADGGEMTWENAGEYCASLLLGGYRDWRLAFAHEAFSILNHNASRPALNTDVFTPSDAEYWWAAETRADDSTRVWATNAGGGMGPHPKEETLSAGGERRYHVRCVRSARKVDALISSFTATGDGTATDNHTGLVWQQQPSEPMTWQDALAYAVRLELGGRDDWRLPNIKELRSLNDDHAVNPSLNTAGFPGGAAIETWSSTTLLNHPERAWTVDFTFGIASYRNKTETLRVRCVRGGFKQVEE